MTKIITFLNNLKHLKRFSGLTIITCVLIIILGINFVVWVSPSLGATIEENAAGDDISPTPARTATIVVAAFDSATASKEQADFVADGINDQETIQTAINALPSTGGKVLLMEGTYNIVPQAELFTRWRYAIRMRANTTLKGQGAGTLLRFPSGLTDVHTIAVLVYNVPNTKILNLSINLNGAGSLYPEWNMAFGVVMRAGGATDGLIQGNHIFGAVYGECISLLSTGVAGKQAGKQKIAFNVLENSGDGIGLNESEFNIVVGNIIRDAFTEGVDLLASHHNIITGNIIVGSGNGIELRSGSSENIITNNRITGSLEEGLSLVENSNYNIISHNHVTESSQARDMGFHSVKISGSSYNSIHGNIIRGATGLSQAHSGIAILLAASMENIVRDNQLRDSGRVGPLVNEGTGTMIRNNTGYITENSGTAVFSGNGRIKSFQIAHGLSAIPTIVNLEARSAHAARDIHWTADATNIRVTFITSPPAGRNNVAIGWEAKIR